MLQCLYIKDVQNYIMTIKLFLTWQLKTQKQINNIKNVGL